MKFVLQSNDDPNIEEELEAASLVDAALEGLYVLGYSIVLKDEDDLDKDELRELFCTSGD